MGDVISLRKLVKIDADIVSGTIYVRVAKTRPGDRDTGFNLETLDGARRLAEAIVQDMLCRYQSDEGDFVPDDDLKTCATDVQFHHGDDGCLEGWSIAVKFERPWTSHRFETGPT